MMSVVVTTHHHRMVSSLALTATARACYDVELTSVQEKVGHLEQLNVLRFSRHFFPAASRKRVWLVRLERFNVFR